MELRKALGFVALAGAMFALTGCDWSATVKKQVGKPVEGELSVKGAWPPPALMRSVATMKATISAADLYIETAGTDFALATTGNAALTISDSNGAILASSSFPWVRSGTKLTFQNPAAIQSWLNQYPSAAGIGAKLSYGSIPADGNDHFMSTVVVYQGVQQASTSATFSAECMTPYRTREICQR
ncbi:hypothetical protein [Rhodanobacter sp. C05]|uniref:hypothetical protein n=1 Tax=Rhodanobacter sp. C05 TaxID=1945855 RepID=UPI0009860A41|nr:hypothetical protein [Rhodanobacter sp. C05]